MRVSQIAGLLTLSAASIAATVSPAVAKVIVYDNSDGTFGWHPGLACFCPPGPPTTHLDITQPPTQSGTTTAHSIMKVVMGGGPYTTLHDYFLCDGTTEMSVLPYGRRVAFLEDFVQVAYFPAPPELYAPTQLIGAGGAWLNPKIKYVQGNVGLLSIPCTLGVRVLIDGQHHYGWIRIGPNVSPLAWAYETEPEVPIVACGEADADGLLHVPGEFASVRNAIVHALPGQEVVLADGTYGASMLDMRGKAITLRSANGPSKCTIKGSHFVDTYNNIMLRIFEFLSGEGPDSVIEGITFQYGATCGGEGPGGLGFGGGAMVFQYGSSPTIRNCVFLDGGAYFGNGMSIRVYASSPTFRDCVFRNTEWFGWAAILNNSGSQFINCLFVESGAAILGNDSAANIVGCTIVNHDFSATWADGAIQGEVGSLTNCILFNNGKASIAPDAVVSVNYSCVEGGWPGVGNIASDPQFVDASADDYHLASGSPCIDAASNPAVPRGVTDDLDGNPRFDDDPATTDTGLGRAPIVDMGAYEFQAPPEPGDLDDDGDVDGFDLALLLGAWTGAAVYAPCSPFIHSADLNADCKINVLDLAILLGLWS